MRTAGNDDDDDDYDNDMGGGDFGDSWGDAGELSMAEGGEALEMVQVGGWGACCWSVVLGCRVSLTLQRQAVLTCVQTLHQVLVVGLRLPA